MKRILLLTAYALGIQFVFSQGLLSIEEIVDVGENRLTVTGILPKILKEASGLEISRSGFLWTHNDDRYPILCAVDTLGSVLKTVQLNHPNQSWEDLAQDADGNVYIGNLVKINLNHFSHKAGLSFVSDTKAYLVELETPPLRGRA